MEVYNNWWEEKRSAYLYAIIAKLDTDPKHRKLFESLHTAAEKQASLWENKLRAEQTTPPVFKPGIRTHLVVLLIKCLGTERVHSILSAMKIRGMSVFSRSHTEHKHTSMNSASNLRAAVFGINDGLVSNISLILGVAGAQGDQGFILVAGIAGLLAGACSMGAGEYISVRSQREVFEYQIAIEKQELQEYPEEEIDELTYIYEARGIPSDEARKLATLMIENPETGLNTLAREELGLNPDDIVSPVGAMVASFVAFSIGAALPLLPFLLDNSPFNLYYSIIITGVTLFSIGATLSLFTNRNPIISGLRMLGVGALAGVITYLVGNLFNIRAV